MFDYNVKKKKIKAKETILDEERFMYQGEIKPRTDARAGDDGPAEISDEMLLVDYLRKPKPEHGVLSLVVSLAGLGFMAASLVLMYGAEGKPQMIIAVLAACSIIWSLAGIWFGFKGLFEKERDYSISFIAIGVSAVQLVFWIILMIVGGQ